MTVEASVYTLGVPLISLVIWQMHRANIRLSEIQREVSGLRDLISRLFLTARNEKPEAASRGSKVPFVDHQQLEPQSLQQGAYDTATAPAAKEPVESEPAREDIASSAAPPEIESELVHVDALCAKLITLAPPKEALSLIARPDSNNIRRERPWPLRTP